MAKRMAVSPAQSARTVIAFGMTVRTGSCAKCRARRALTLSATRKPRPERGSNGGVGPDILGNLYAQLYMMRHSKCRVGKNRLAGNRGLTDRNERHRALRQIHVKAAAEADNAEAFACREVVPFLHIAHDAARDETGNLHHHDILAIRALDHHGVALIRIARLVEIGIEEKAGAI